MSVELLALASNLSGIEKGFAEAVANLTADTQGLGLELDLPTAFGQSEENQKFALAAQEQELVKQMQQQQKAESIMRSHLDFSVPSRIQKRI